MAKSKRKAGKRAGTAGRSGMRALKSSLSKARKPGLSTPSPAKTGPRKQKPSVSLETTRLKRQLKSARKETQEALERQTATADVLKVIASSPTEIESALKTMVESACRFCGAYDATLLLKDGNYLSYSAHFGPIPFPREPHLITRQWVTGRSVVDGKPVQVSDFLAPDAASEFPEGHQRASEQGHRCSLAVPLLREGDAIGAITLRRLEPLAFDSKQVALLQTFADQAVIAIENARLFNEVQTKSRDLEETLRYQTGSANILNVIASSPTDAQPALKAIVESACELCEAHDAVVLLKDGNDLCFSAHQGPIPINTDKWPIGRGWAAGRAVVDRETVHVHDVYAEDDFTDSRELSRRAGSTAVRSILAAPLLREGEGIGAILLRRQEVRPFNDKQIAMLRTFADQAVIAIENSRLFNQVQAKTRDLTESLDQQIATGEVLKAISHSAFDLQPVFDAIAENSVRLCHAERAFIFRFDGQLLRAISSFNVGPEVKQFVDQNPISLGRHSISARAGLERRTVHVADVHADPEYAYAVRDVELIRTILAVPMLKSDQLVGVITIYRLEVKPFTDKQVSLVENFAAQAVIAIENARLFNEVQAKTQDLTEALRYQTGSANILNVIASSPTNVLPVLQAIVESACELCGAYDAFVRLRDGNYLVPSAHSGPIPTNSEKWLIERRSVSGRAVIDKKPVHVHDMQSAEGKEFSESQRRARELGHRTILSMPLLHEDDSIGVIVLRRTEADPFTDKQITLLQTFAAQAVIAIENVRLFKETQEALERQTATADVLKVIASSPSDTQPVFEAIVQSGLKLFPSSAVMVVLADGDTIRPAAIAEADSRLAEMLRRAFPVPLTRDYVHAVAILDNRVVDIPDAQIETDEFPIARRQFLSSGHRAITIMPMMRGDESIGALSVVRQLPGRLSDRQLELLKTFSDQAVIAIENARLLSELRHRTSDLAESLQQQTATADVLQIISTSPGDLAPVFDKMLENATLVCGAEFGSMNLLEGDMLRQAALYNAPSAFAAERLDKAFRIHPRSSLADAIRGKQVVQVEDMRKHPAYLERNPSSVQLTELAGARTIVVVPMLRENEVIGVITVYRQEVRPFNDKQIELLSNFAKQAVIAIENARLLKELRQRTADLSKSLDDLRAAQDRLIQTEKLASLGQLTAGIAHEIKNPLNFVNNFSQLSAELVDEMTEIFENPALDEASRRKELDEIRELLKGNLEKVVQHGRRADSIVKNMLLHSREGSGEQRSADINALVEESLNLAYHGARAEKPDFAITLNQDLDPDAGVLDLYPQEITRALLNLISNGFYAATRRKAENGDGDFEPVLSAATRNLGETVEIRIRDNGTGITPEVREKMFNPFFTTKPTGEGTGLGLSMTHDIVVKQHGGRIDVETEPGAFTEFIITLPRGNGKAGGLETE